MDHARNKIKFTFLTLLLFTSCSRKPEEQLVSVLENKYANLYVNNKEHKMQVIADLKSYLNVHQLNDENLKEITSKIHQINDGHVVLFDSRAEKNILYKSGIHFIPGSTYIKNCKECTPSLADDKYEILEINNSPLKAYLENEKFSVAASTPWGRDYRIIHKLEERNNNSDTTIKVKSSAGKVIDTKITWATVTTTPPACVSGERLKENVYKINVMSLWCEDTTVKIPWTRDQILTNFRKQFDEAASPIKSTDKIIVDLRDNGGGGDFEVEYVLNAFNEKSVFMYHYKYLRKTHPGKRKWLERFWPFKLSLWAADEYDYTNTNAPHRPIKTFYDNKIITLISAGCFSSCETIASSLKLEKRSPVLGTRTHGGSGDPIIFAISGTPFSINIPTCITWQENGRFYEGSGVHPNQELIQNPNIVSDNVLTSAIDLVQ